MRICYLDAFSGLSGDMTVGALADAGADSGRLVEGLRSLNTGAEFRFEKTKRRGIAATRFVVEGGEQRAHRHLGPILRMIEGGALPERAKQNAARVFQRLGEAEARVHAVPIEKVHFHEVGAVDSIADIVGACLGLELLGVEQVYSSAVNTGSGTVETEHGVLPVPAPATAALLAGAPVYARGPQVELTTPTGAAIASTLARRFGPPPAMRIAQIGYGAGGRDFPEHANVLRVLVGEAAEVPEALAVSVIEANLDDSTPQVLAYAMERLLESGALDVSLTPLVMKKGRPGTLLRVIARPEQQEELAGVLMRETSTLGLRLYTAERRVAERTFAEVETRYGKVRVKVTPGGFAPEYEDCRELARQSGAPLKEILAEAGFAYWKSIR